MKRYGELYPIDDVILAILKNGIAASLPDENILEAERGVPTGSSLDHGA